MKHYGDIKQINGSDVPPVNVIIGGSPCQDLSVAGKRAGLSGERSGLFMEQIRIIKEMREESERSGATDIKPRFMVWENVPGALSSNKGQDFRAVLEETARIVEKELPDIPVPEGGWHYSGVIMGNGFSIAWRVFDAQFWGVPQRRRRIALVADFGGQSAPEILFERKGVSGDSEPCGETGQETAGAAGKSVEGASSGVVAKGNGDCFLTPERHTSLTTGGGQAGQGYPCVLDERGAGVGVDVYNQEVTGVLPFDTTQITSPQNGCNPHYGDPCHPLAAGAHPPAVAIGNGQLNQMSMAEQANTLDTMHDQQAVMVAAVDCRNLNESQVSGTLQSKENGGYSLNYQNPVRIQGAYIDAETRSKILLLLQETYGEEKVLKWGIAILERLQQTDILQQGVHESRISGETEKWNKLDDCALPCPELVAGWMLRDMWEQQKCGRSPQGWESSEQQPGQFAESLPELSQQNSQACKNLFDMWQKGERLWLLRQALSEIQKIWKSINSQRQSVYGHSIVRRLTPLEAERLQGFPDGWTDIGDYIDTKGKKRKTSDSARYKALGNSIALPSWVWVLERLSYCCGADRTMASLFDGIGGFPLIWETLNGAGTCLWASEIEKFPIAVTKLRFGED